MHVLITGGGGFLGARLARALLARDRLDVRGERDAMTRLTLLDTAFGPDMPPDPRVECITGDMTDPAVLRQSVAPETRAVFHLAAVVSGAAEADFDLGMRVNLGGTQSLLERTRACRRPPRLVFASSVAAFGGRVPEVLDDTTTPTPQTSYGTQKVIGEYLVSDYSRKGFIDGCALRLPTVVVRPGRANAAASSFASAVIREPLNGQPYDCPVAPDTGVWLLSPGRVVSALLHACALPADAWADVRVLNLPGITVTVAQMLESLARVAGREAAHRVGWRADPAVQAIVGTWPTRFVTPRANALGFGADPDMDSIVRAYVDDAGIRLPASAGQGS